jgi:glycosyltransferase involved in cell wall biosynthesis
VIVHQLLSGAGPHDAVTAQALAFRTRFEEWGWGGEDVAVAIDPQVGRAVRSVDGWHPGAASDVLLIHYSAYAARLRSFLGGPNPTLLLSHNVTPAKWLWDHEPMVAVRCEVGRIQLADFARAADLCAGVSEYNAAELRAAGARSVTTLPILFEPPDGAGAGAGAGAGDTRPPGPPEILFVGRLAPHKRHDEVLRAFALYRGRHAPGATLRFVGSTVSASLSASLAGLADQLAPGAAIFESGLSRDELWDRYRRASAFLCLSEHEGFCIPVLEAFAAGVPVIARPVGGVPEVAGDAALLVEDRDLAVVCELLNLVISDGTLRSTLVARGRARAEAYAPDVTAAKLRAAVESVA